jgi:hypothetical protein
MKRRLFSILCALSFLLYFLAAMMWVRTRSHVATAEFHGGSRTTYELASGGGWACAAVSVRSGRSMGESPMARDVLSEPARWGASCGVLTTVTMQQDMQGGTEMTVTRYCLVSYPLALTATAILPLIAASNWLRRKSRSKAGHCPSCGYDVRATPNRCPECGKAPN